MTLQIKDRKRVVIVGAGFGGLAAATALHRAPVEVLLIDKNNYHTFQPLLYQVATAGLEPEEIAHAVRGIYQRQRNFDFRMAEVTGIDFERKEIRFRDGDSIGYDYLILSAGAVTNDFGIRGVREFGLPLKGLTDAIRIRSHVIRQFERAAADPSLIDEGILNFVIVGGGPTGVEMAGALIELFRKVLQKDFPTLEVNRARVILVEATGRLLSAFADHLQEYTAQTLQRRGVEVMLDTSVVEVSESSVHLAPGGALPAHTLIWAAGIRAATMADHLGLQQTRGGRISVEADLSVPGHPEVFVVGDLAGSVDEKGELHPQLAPVAQQGARYAARQIMARERGRKVEEPFRYVDKGIMATIGRNAAVAEIEPGIKTKGFLAWLIWLFLHLMMLVGFRNRVQVFINWAWNYFTYDRSARMIVDVAGEDEAAGAAPHLSRAGQSTHTEIHADATPRRREKQPL